MKYSTCIANCTFFFRLIFHLQHLLKCTKRNNNKFPGKKSESFIFNIYLISLDEFRLCCKTSQSLIMLYYQKNPSYCYALSFLFYRKMRYLYICHCILLIYLAIKL